MKNIVKITDMSFKAVNSGSALVNVYRDGKNNWKYHCQCICFP